MAPPGSAGRTWTDQVRAVVWVVGVLLGRQLLNNKYSWPGIPGGGVVYPARRHSQWKGNVSSKKLAHQNVSFTEKPEETINKVGETTEEEGEEAIHCSVMRHLLQTPLCRYCYTKSYKKCFDLLYSFKRKMARTHNKL